MSDLILIDNPGAQDTERYMTITLDVSSVIESWRNSLRAYEWLDSEGKIKDSLALGPVQSLERQNVLDQFKKGQDLMRPILGWGILDSVEVASQAAVFVVYAEQGLKQIRVHILKSQEKDFKPFLPRA